MAVIRSKFRGCLLGALLGDALGQKFEGCYWNEPVPEYKFEELSKETLSTLKESGGLLRYTDDTSMTKAICRSLLSYKSLNVKDLANEFAEEYFREPWRGYGNGVITVFQRLHTEKQEDVFLPAREQFDGAGSYGNGAAMRVAPLALFYSNDFEQLKIAAKQNALITHSHIHGVNGSILQAVAVHETLNTSAGSLDVEQYIEKLIEIAKGFEEGNDQYYGDNREMVEGDGENKKGSYVTQFEHIKRMLNNEHKPDLYEVIKTLGHGVKAIEAVPAAVFSFLSNADACFKDAILYAISLGGDTDTIASMTGAIAGAYWGEQDIPDEWLVVTESVDEVIQFANQLHGLKSNKEVV